MYPRHDLTQRHLRFCCNICICYDCVSVYTKAVLIIPLAHHQTRYSSGLITMATEVSPLFSQPGSPASIPGLKYSLHPQMSLLLITTAALLLNSIIIFSNSCRRRLEIYPRRNPRRKARPVYNVELSNRPMTRSMSQDTNGAGLAEGLEDDQEVKRVVYRTW